VRLGVPTSSSYETNELCEIKTAAQIGAAEKILVDEAWTLGLSPL